MVSLERLRRLGVTDKQLAGWTARGLLRRAGPHSFVIGGSGDLWHRALAIALADVGVPGFIAGRSAARLYRIEGFEQDVVEVLVPFAARHRTTLGVVRSTRRTIPRSDTRTVDGLTALTPERLILDSPIFRFTRDELEQVIDGAIRRRLVSESRLRRRAEERHTRGVRGGRALIDALVDSGGESSLERRFLALVREAGLPRPTLQRTYRDGRRTLARVDFVFPNGLIVEVAGHATHSDRAHRNRDAERSNDLVLRAAPVLTFTYEHVTYRPAYVIHALRRAFGVLAS